MYVKAFDDDTIPDTETLLLTYIHVHVFTQSITLAYDDC